MLEGEYKTRLIKKIESRLPGCLVLKNDPNYLQGIPDLTILCEDWWGFLEVKTSVNAEERPNQGYYIGRAATASFGAFIYPENEKEVLDALSRSFRTRGSTRVSQSK